MFPKLIVELFFCSFFKYWQNLQNQTLLSLRQKNILLIFASVFCKSWVKRITGSEPTLCVYFTWIDEMLFCRSTGFTADVPGKAQFSRQCLEMESSLQNTQEIKRTSQVLIPPLHCIMADTTAWQTQDETGTGWIYSFFNPHKPKLAAWFSLL